MWGVKCQRKMTFANMSAAEFILLVEKDAAFQRLAEDRFYNTYPCIIITGSSTILTLISQSQVRVPYSQVRVPYPQVRVPLHHIHRFRVEG